MGIDISPRAFRDKCAERGLRVTPQREIIFKELMRAKDHPSADAVFRRVRRALPNISFDTVHRTLLSFSENGLACQVEGYGEQRRFEPDLEPHHHFRCLKCRAIIDVRHSVYDALSLPPGLPKGCTVLKKRVVLEGVCESCERKG